MTLTDEQLSVVNLVSGRHLVLAPPGSGKTELLAAIGDFVYHRSGTLRLDAATCLAAQGITRWNGVIRGASTDFVRLESAADAEHEETIRAILAKKDLPDEYERRLRAILFARARRKM